MERTILRVCLYVTLVPLGIMVAEPAIEEMATDYRSERREAIIRAAWTFHARALTPFCVILAGLACSARVRADVTIREAPAAEVPGPTEQPPVEPMKIPETFTWRGEPVTAAKTPRQTPPPIPPDHRYGRTP